MKKQTKKGFTLVELVIVIAVIAILSAILIPTFGNVIKEANETAAYDSAKTAYQNFLVENGKNIEYADSAAYILVLEKEVDNNNEIEKTKYIFEVKDATLIKPTESFSNLKTNMTTEGGKVVVKGTVAKSKTPGEAYKIAANTYIVFKNNA